MYQSLSYLSLALDPPAAASCFRESGPSMAMPSSVPDGKVAAWPGEPGEPATPRLVLGDIPGVSRTIIQQANFVTSHKSVPVLFFVETAISPKDLPYLVQEWMVLRLR